jgi:TonB family protein
MTLSRRRVVVFALGFIGLVANAPHPAAQSAAEAFTPLFNGTSLKGWQVEHTKADTRADFVRVKSGAGWVRTDRVSADFVLHVDIRVTSPQTRAGVFVRAWPTFEANTSRPANGYRVTLPTTAARDWRHLEIECLRQAMTVRLDGVAVYENHQVANPQGHIALWSEDGDAEFRAIELRELPLPKHDAPQGVFVMADVSEPPRVLTEVKPAYSKAALDQRIQGSVMFGAVVLPDGTVGETVLVRSLDPLYGLDQIAEATVKKWRFRPATRGGEPVPIYVVIELRFNLI